MASSRLTSALTVATISLGVPAGMNRPYQVLTSKSLKPSSATVGTSGSDVLRRAEVTARVRSLPALIWPMAEGSDETIRSTLPASTSIMAGLEPL